MHGLCSGVNYIIQFLDGLKICTITTLMAGHAANYFGSLGVAVTLLTRDWQIPYMQARHLFLHLAAGFGNPAEHHGNSQRAN